MGKFVAKKQDATSESTKWCIVCTAKPDLTTATSRQRNRAKPPRNLVLGLKKWIGHVRCEKTRRNFGKHNVVHFMHPKTRSHNGYLPATESRETTQKFSFGPKEVDLACSLRKNKTQLRKHKVVHFMHPKSDLTTCTSRQRNRAKPPINLVLGLNKWIGHVRCEKQDATSEA